MIARLLLLPLIGAWIGTSIEIQEPGSTPPDQHAESRALFVQHCASCHGEKGDGQGVTDLDRQARSFLDGGFSYGNTPEALYRTLTSGIPGTPMPSFDGALTDDQRRALASYVVTLGPPITHVDEGRTIVYVEDEAVIVRGMLPPITDGAKDIVRGLLVGLPGGTTFEYAVDDVRLLGVRRGGFVKRRDWVGRGGQGLAPMGTLTTLEPEGTAPFKYLEQPATRRLTSTRVEGPRAVLEYDIVQEGQVVRRIIEEVSSKEYTAGFGYSRKLTGYTSVGEEIQAMRTNSVYADMQVHQLEENRQLIRVVAVHQLEEKRFQITIMERKTRVPEPSRKVTKIFTDRWSEDMAAPLIEELVW